MVNRSSKFPSVVILAIGMFLMTSYQNCAGDFKFQNQSENVQLQSVQEPTYDGLSKVSCQFVGPNLLQDRLKNILGIAAGDVPVLSDTGTATTTMRIQSALDILGQGNINQGRPDDFTCATTKFKSAMQVMVDACTAGVQNPTIKSKLFPSGLSNFDTLYLNLVGRLPTDAEVGALMDLLTKVSNANAEAAVCSAVAVSFESLIRI